MEVINGAPVDAPEMGFELGECHLDRVAIRAIGGQEQKPAPGLFQTLCSPCAFVGGQIIEDNDLAGGSAGTSCVST